MIQKLAKYPSLRKRTQEILKDIASLKLVGNREVEIGNCASCGVENVEVPHENKEKGEDLGLEDRLALYFHTLPGNIPEYYIAKGKIR